MIQINGQRIPSASFGDTAPFDPPLAPADALDHVAGPHDQPLLVLTTHVEVGGRRVALAVGEDLSQLRRDLLEFRLVFLALCTVVLARAVVLQGRELRWALRPLDTIRDAVLQMPEDGKPVVAGDAPTEIRPLVEELNRLLAFVGRRLQQSRTAIGDLSHAVKTPLAAVFRLLDDPRLAASPDLKRAIQEQVDAIHMRVDRELKRARLADDEPVDAAFDAHAELPALVRLLRQIHRDKLLAVEWTAPEPRNSGCHTDVDRGGHQLRPSDGRARRDGSCRRGQSVRRLRPGRDARPRPDPPPH